MKNNNNVFNAPRLYKAPEQKELLFNKAMFYICIIIVFLLFWFIGSIFNNNMNAFLNGI